MIPFGKLLRALALLLTFSIAVARAVEKPNVIFILADDLGFVDLSSRGHPRIKTPNLDRLRAQSVRFTDHHVSSVARLLLDGKEIARQPVSAAPHARFNFPLKHGERNRLEGQFLDAAGQTLCGYFFTLVSPAAK